MSLIHGGGLGFPTYTSNVDAILGASKLEELITCGSEASSSCIVKLKKKNVLCNSTTSRAGTRACIKYLFIYLLTVHVSLQINEGFLFTAKLAKRAVLAL